MPLAVPLVTLLLLAAAPWRVEPWFAARWSVFASARWNLLRVGTLGVGDLAWLLAAGLGAILFLRDAVPPLLDVLRPRRRVEDAGPWGRVPQTVAAEIERLAARLGVPPPRLRVVRAGSPVLMCRGGRDPELVLSPATFEHLQGEDLRSALVHELVHVAHRDPFWGYLLMAARALGFFNPAAQWAARAAVDEIERRADQRTVSLTGNGEALAGAIATLFSSGHPPPLEDGPTFERLFWRARAAGVARRCARLRSAPIPPPPDYPRLQFALAAAGVVVLVFFVI